MYPQLHLCKLGPLTTDVLYKAVRLEYQTKRDFFIDCIAKYCDPKLVSTKPCGGGMFQFVEINVKSHPQYKHTQILPSKKSALSTNGSIIDRKSFTGTSSREYTTNTEQLMDDLWQSLVDEAEVLLMPASIFLVERPGVDQTDRLNFFRATVR